MMSHDELHDLFDVDKETLARMPDWFKRLREECLKSKNYD